MREGLLRTMTFNTLRWASVNVTNKSSIDSRAEVGDFGEEAARKMRAAVPVELEPTYLQTTIRDSMSGKRTVAICSISGLCSMIERQSPNRFHNEVNLNDS